VATDLVALTRQHCLTPEPLLFHFTIRDVLWLTVVALASGWWFYRQQTNATLEKLRLENIALHTAARMGGYDAEWTADREFSVKPRANTYRANP